MVITDEKKFDSFVKKMNLADETLISFLKDTKYGTKDLASYQQYLKESSQSMTLFQRAGKAAGTAMRTLGATLGSMAAAWAIGEVISLAITGIDHLVNAEKYEQQAFEDATEAAKKYSDQIKETREELKKTEESANSISQRYAELVQGVNANTNENESLSNDDYKEFLDLNNQLAELFPTLTKGYDDNGNAILGLSGGVDTVTESIRKLVEQQERLAKQDLKDNLEKYVNGDDESEGQLKSIEGQKKKVDELKTDLEDLEKYYNAITKGETLEAKSGSLIDQDYFWKLADSAKDASTTDFYDTATPAEEQFFKQLLTGDGGRTYDFSKLKLTEADRESIAASYENLYNDLRGQLDTAKSELDTKNKELSQQMMIWVEDLDLYKDNTSLQNPLLTLVQNIDWASQGLDNFEEVKKFIQDNVLTDLQTACNDPDTKAKVISAYSSLFTIDFSKMSIEDARKKLEELFKAIILSINPELNEEDYQKKLKEYYTKFNMSSYFETSDKINASIGSGQKDKNGNVNGIAQNEEEVKKLKAFTKDFNIEQAEMWLTATNGSKNAQDAIDSYNKKLEESKKSSKTASESFSSVWKELKKTEKSALKKSVISGTFDQEELDKYQTLANNFSLEQVRKEVLDLVGLDDKIGQFLNDTDKLTSAFQEMKKNKIVSTKTLQDMPDGFRNLKGYTKFRNTVVDPKISKANKKNAFEDLINEYLKVNDTIKNVTSKTKNYVISALKDVGIVNAEKVVNSYLNGVDKQFSQLESKFNKMSKTELQNFVKTLNEKGKVSSEFYKKIGINNANMINGLSDQYKTDFANWVELCEKKRDTYNKLAKAVGGKNTKEAKKNAIKLMSKDESKVTSKDMGAYETMTKDGLQVVTTKKGKKKVITKYDKQQKKLADKLKLDIADVKFGTKYSPTSPLGNKSKKDKSKSTQVIDWIERKLNRLNTKLDLDKAKYDNLQYTKKNSKNSTSLLNAENKNLGKQIKLLKQVQSVNNKSYSKYMKKAKKSATYTIGKGKKKKTYKLSKSLKKKIQNGRIKGSYKQLIATYGEAKANAIQKYQDYYDKAESSRKNSQDAKKSIADAKISQFTNAQNYYDTLNAMNQAYESTAKGLSKNNYVQEQIEAIKQSYNYQIKIARAQGDYNKAKQLEQEKEKAILDLQRQKIENIKTFYDYQVGLLDNDKQDIQNQIDLIEARGDIISRGYYKNLTNEDNAIIAKREAELKDLKSQLSTKDQGTDNWYELQSDIQSVENEINDHKKSVYENTKAIGELNNKMYEAIYAVSSNLNAELDTISSLKRGETSDSDTGTLTDAGLLQLYAAGLSYSATKGTAAEANARLAEIIKANKSGKVLEGYTSLQAQKDAEAQLAKDAQDQVTSVKSYGDKIIEIIKDAISSVKDHLQEIIDARKEALNEEKDLRDYERSILEKTKNVSSLQKQFMAVSGDTSEEGRLRATQLRKSLDEAQQDLQDTEYDRYISDQQEMLDNMMNQFQDLMEKLQKDEDALLREGIIAINNQKGIMQQVFNKTAEDYGYPTSTNLKELQSALTTGRITADIINSAKDDSVTSVIKAKCDEIVKAYNNSSNGNSNGGTGGGNGGGNGGTGGTPSTGGNNSNSGNSGGGESLHIGNGNNNTVMQTSYGKTRWGNDKSTWNSAFKNTLELWLENESKKKKPKVKKAKKGKTYKSDLNNMLSKNFGYILSTENGGLKAIQDFLNITKNDKNWSSNGYVYKELEELLKGLGCFRTGGIAKMIKQSGEDGVAFVRNGEGFVMPENVKDIRDLMAVTPDLTELVTNLTKVPNVKPLDRNVTKNVSIDNITFDMPNVTNATDFTDTIKKPEQQKAFAVAIGDAINGKKLNINRY